MTEHIRGGAIGVATRLDRRQALRRGSQTLFSVLAIFAAGGGVKVASAIAANACLATGPGCPPGYGCGPSPCCNAPGRSSACQCGTGTSCMSTSNCHGYARTWSGTSCWTCVNGRRTTTCCDCSTSGCGDPQSRCISYYSSLGPPKPPAVGGTDQSAPAAWQAA